MMTVNRKGDGKWEKRRASKNRPQQKPPKLKPFLSKNAEADPGAKKSHKSLKIHRCFKPWRFVLSQKNLNPLIVESGGIDVPNDVPVPLAQCLKVHLSDDVCRTVGITRHMTEQTALFFKAFIKTCAGRCLKQADHGRHDTTSLYKIYLPLEYGGSVTVKSHDKTSLNL